MFCRTKNIQYKFPFTLETLTKYTYWALQDRKLKHSTVEAYISAIELYHRLLGFHDCSFNSPILKLMLKGSENLSVYERNKEQKRNVMSLPLLKVLGHEISLCNWSIFEKQLVWTVACVAFFGSFRIGELLNSKGDTFDPGSSLTWGDVKMLKNSFLLHVRSPKSKNKLGDFVDIFEFEGHNCCPVRAFHVYRNLCLNKQMNSANLPVFRHENGKIFTKTQFNNMVDGLLNRRYANTGLKITRHSFRAGIPAALAKFPEISSDNHIMGWGRWDSGAYLSYTRLKIDQKKNIFKKIVSVLNSQCK